MGYMRGKPTSTVSACLIVVPGWYPRYCGWKSSSLEYSRARLAATLNAHIKVGEGLLMSFPYLGPRGGDLGAVCDTSGKIRKIDCQSSNHVCVDIVVSPPMIFVWAHHTFE